MSTLLPVWLDAVYAAWIDAPHEVLEKATKHFAIEEARIDPEAARATWGLRPEHQMLNRGFGQDAPADIPAMPRGDRAR